MGFRVLPRAEADIEAIADYINADSPFAARKWLDDLYEHFQRLGHMPGIGVLRSEINLRLRLFPFGSYLVLYHEETHGIDVIRVVHGRRDPETWLSS
ncbi:toxin ParE1/3/4 [Bosea sp. CRIB-10]|uniref:type II toxin-antitoxin system RelE/ParE family toxin n=1 Tax=Bosea sp. CRIB-10 TaxID=378404 RepID=UPI0008E160F7|nr:type II toxin-antitoxin system RelE/ParE family toxin [Bosea sp. CRIB-10]SFC31024.1 toxin ParE1/3/4 [Bosea sp. CRIB-10]